MTHNAVHGRPHPDLTAPEWNGRMEGKMIIRIEGLLEPANRYSAGQETYWQASARRVREAGYESDPGVMSDYHAHGLCGGARAGCRLCAGLPGAEPAILRSPEEWDRMAEVR